MIIVNKLDLSTQFIFFYNLSILIILFFANRSCFFSCFMLSFSLYLLFYYFSTNYSTHSLPSVMLFFLEKQLFFTVCEVPLLSARKIPLVYVSVSGLRKKAEFDILFHCPFPPSSLPSSSPSFLNFVYACVKIALPF